MPRAPSEKLPEAERLYRSGMPLARIASKIDVPASTVRNWKKRYGWDTDIDESKKKASRKTSQTASRKNTGKAPKRKEGGQPGNKNALGNRGNPHPVPTSNYKHGGYAAVYWDTLDEDEKDLLGSGSRDEEELLIEQIDLFSIRERRLMKAINKYRLSSDDMAVDFSIKTETARAFKDSEEEAAYNEAVQEKILSGEYMPGRKAEITAQRTNKDNYIIRLESELSNVQSKKTKAVEALAKLRLEKQKIAADGKNDDALQAWIDVMQEKIGDADG